jgi:hypothetical protein
MQTLLQTFVVALLVAGSAVFAAWRLAPARLKLRVLDNLKPDTQHVWGRWVARLRGGVVQQVMHGCSACSRAPDHIQKQSGARKAS